MTTYLFTREQLEACILEPGQRVNPDSFVLVAESPPRFVRGEAYNAALDAKTQITAYLAAILKDSLSVETETLRDGYGRISIHKGEVRHKECERLEKGIVACGARSATVMALPRAPYSGAILVSYTLPDGVVESGEVWPR